jgi:hypothetical protein
MEYEILYYISNSLGHKNCNYMAMNVSGNNTRQIFNNRLQNIAILEISHVLRKLLLSDTWNLSRIEPFVHEDNYQ